MVDNKLINLVFQWEGIKLDRNLHIVIIGNIEISRRYYGIYERQICSQSHRLGLLCYS